MNKKAIVIVLDSVGIGELPDAADYGDKGADTLGHIINTCHPNLPHMMELGLANIDGAGFSGAVDAPKGCYGKLREVSAGKDTTTGHWEIAGIQLAHAFPTFPNGFPQDFIEKFEQAVGRGTLGNKPASGTAILDELGEELTGKLEVGRVIARPFVGDHAGAFKRTGARRDFSAQPPTTMCDILAENGKTVYGVGKIEDIFDHRGITKSNHAAGNPACMQATFEAMDEDFDGLLFVNLVDFDMVYGHRRDVKGYAAALETFDAQLPEIQAKMGEDDLLIITADHGCDPCHSGTDHTREHTPLLVWSKKMQGGANLGVRATYADISATVLDYFGLANPLHGVSFLKELK